MDLDKYIMICIHRCGIIQGGFTVLELLCALTIHPSLAIIFFKIKRFYLFVFIERGREGEKEGARH